MDNNFSQEQKNKIIEMYQNNVNIDDIINEFSSTEHFIREVLKESNIDRVKTSMSQELRNRLIFLYRDKKFSQKNVAYSLCINRTTIPRLLKRNNIHVRGAVEGNRKYDRNSYYFDSIDSPNKAYILGLLYADGNIHISKNSNQYVISLSLQETDKSLLESIKNELEYTGPLRFVPLNENVSCHKNAFLLAITDEYMAKKLMSLGVIERKSLCLKYPKFLRPDLVRHFIRGYFDGDGNIQYDNKRNKCQARIVGTKEFCEGVADILRAYNIKCNIQLHDKGRDSNTYVLGTSANKSSYAFLSFLYQDCEIKLERKYRQYLDFCDYLNKKIV